MSIVVGTFHRVSGTYDQYPSRPWDICMIMLYLLRAHYAWPFKRLIFTTFLQIHTIFLYFINCGKNMCLDKIISLFCLLCIDITLSLKKNYQVEIGIYKFLIIKHKYNYLKIKISILSIEQIIYYLTYAPLKFDPKLFIYYCI